MTSRPPRRLALMGLILAAGLHATPASAADGILQRFVGEWVGRGEVRFEAGGQPRRTFCRVTGELEQGGRVLRQSGRCAAGEDTRRISARFVRQSGSLYAGSWDAGMGEARVSGEAKGNTLDLVVESGGGIPEGASPTITLTFAQEGAYVMDMTGVDPGRGGRFDVGRIVFRKE